MKQDHTQVTGLQSYIAFVIAAISTTGAISILINFNMLNSVTVNAEAFTLIFAIVVYTLANSIVFFSMFRRTTTRYWLISWLLVAFLADLATVPLSVALGRSVGDQISYIISLFGTYILLMGWFGYSEHARGFYNKSYKEQTEELLNK